MEKSRNAGSNRELKTLVFPAIAPPSNPLYLETNSGLPIIGVGGIFTAEDARLPPVLALPRYTRAGFMDGASHFRGFAAKLEERGLASISEAVGREELLHSP